MWRVVFSGSFWAVLNSWGRVVKTFKTEARARAYLHNLQEQTK